MPQESPHQLPLRTYRSRYAVKALRWTGTEECREQLAAWFKSHGLVLETRGPQVILSGQEGGLHPLVSVGDWVLYSGGEFFAMPDPLFTEIYEEVP